MSQTMVRDEIGADDNDGSRSVGRWLPDFVCAWRASIQLSKLADHHNSTFVLSGYSFINGCLSIGLMSALALITHEPFVFPSLGPTAFLFFYTPLAPTASPRNAVFGHLIGVGAGWGSLALFGLVNAEPSLVAGVDGPRVGAAALSLGLTAGLMVLFKVPHPPAGATTLIISLGLLRYGDELVVLMIGVVLLTVQAIVINRLAGLPYPLWSPIEVGEGEKAP